MRRQCGSDHSDWSSVWPVLPSPPGSDWLLFRDGGASSCSISSGSGVWLEGSKSQASSDSSVWEGLQSKVNSDWSSVNEGLSWSGSSDEGFVMSPGLASNCTFVSSEKLTGISLYWRSGWSSTFGGLGSRGKESPLWRMHSLWSSVTSDTFVVFPLSRKLASGGRTFTPVTVTEPSMALRSWRCGQPEKKRKTGRRAKKRGEKRGEVEHIT